MCGRFALGAPRARVLRAVHYENPDLNVDLNEWVDEDSFEPRFNIAPRTRSPVIRRRNRSDDRTSGGETPELVGTVMHTMKWGLVPHWSKHEDMSLNTINAKGESLVDGGGMWAGLKGRKRCAVVCQGYYEWLKKGKDRIPHFTKHPDGKLMLLAGLYDSVVLEGSTEPLWTFTIVTTDASKHLSWLHDRMPVVLNSSTELSAWLDTSSQTWEPDVANLIRPFVAHELECYAVPTDVGRVGAQSPTFVEPVSRRKDGIEAMFAKQQHKGESTSGSSPSSARIGKKEAPNTDDPELASSGATKRRRESPDWIKRDPSVEFISSEEARSPKKPRIKLQEQEEIKPKKSKSPKLHSSPIKSRTKQSKPAAAEQRSLGSSKITNFFARC